MAEFLGKKVLVIGGSRGIGTAIVKRLTHDGASVSFTWAGSRTKADELARQTGAEAIQADATNRSEMVSVVRNAGSIDIFVFNAGICIAGDPLTLNPDDVDRMIDINIRAAYHCAVEAARSMPDGGRIILIGSTNANRVPFKGLAAYSMTKSALQSMVRGLARDFGDRHITVNVIQPGPTDTDMNPANGPQADLMHSVMAIKEHGSADDVAAYVSFLASNAARGITGAMQTIDGGFSA
ncbi:oxidoreductase [Acetobacter pasteurianus NBRC 3280]|uniref:Oxidoreductase n=1 Tax=Acetobacter pasteurianus NBRC 3278 TaxID=1226660 RepID=A0A401X3J2_ACEPA|nr:SDR family oxidoreductase [Acetobacter pasteurianus]GCD58898.1 oxidoreductase [Acetobacter pasteurianus NBRC 3277]GCD62391.1 oxidoreductase [Acetobacter pasteurianus NBRC 3278]GCD68763.1 oxidoreductase [Acetobacter pasteurianus NBRC 3280]